MSHGGDCGEDDPGVDFSPGVVHSFWVKTKSFLLTNFTGLHHGNYTGFPGYVYFQKWKRFNQFLGPFSERDFYTFFPDDPD